ncbi:hypothetical protein PspS34_15510 [Pseudomonas sp. S34]|uniref:zinc ribbon domain-containing protein n=1 Tax=Pseudomonas sp. S34 TaxID=1573718 RepID=UPI00132F377E|nr:zinc ribbon domain-containing protein [Pseudomonas sp. S34]QHF39585.1 hypothetical protein PspS34_15510 [Pseudomonas sp. S34]
MPSESLFTKCKSCGKTISKIAQKCPDCGKKVKKISAIQWVGIIFGALIVIGAINSSSKPKPQEEAESPATIKKKVSNEVSLEYTWKKKSLGAIMEADLLIKNNSVADIKDIEIQCNHFAKSETKIDSNNRTIYEIIKAKSESRYLKFNMGFIHDQANSSSCFIKDFSIVSQ